MKKNMIFNNFVSIALGLLIILIIVTMSKIEILQEDWFFILSYFLSVILSLIVLILSYNNKKSHWYISIFYMLLLLVIGIEFFSTIYNIAIRYLFLTNAIIFLSIFVYGTSEIQKDRK